MTWKVELDSRAAKELRSLDPEARRRILRFLRERVATADDPRRIGRPLQGQSAPLWRYRVGSFRLICSIEDDRLIVLVVRVGHRREVYR
ncbi:MAG TPA: type II toxin-antitoxin system RelE/ParE family toxin [Thermoanaerobaculia bacterium]|nr:type II toxin-antitoxin system RelE/ParE family toxin [Thermoanaerobaculia bacterium]